MWGGRACLEERLVADAIRQEVVSLDPSRPSQRTTGGREQAEATLEHYASSLSKNDCDRSWDGVGT